MPHFGNSFVLKASQVSFITAMMKKAKKQKNKETSPLCHEVTEWWQSGVDYQYSQEFVGAIIGRPKRSIR